MAMQPGHGARFDAAGESIAADQVVSLPDFRDKRGNRRPIIGVVAVSHDDDSAARGLDSRVQGHAVALDGFEDHPRAEIPGDLRRVIGRPVVDHDHLARNPHRGETTLRLLHADADAARLVEARDYR